MTKKLMIILCLISFSLLTAQSNHTIVVDGTINTGSGEMWSNSGERFSTSSSSTIYGYMTWDSANIYIAWPQVDFDGTNQAVYVVFDTDPQNTPKSGNGSDNLGFDLYFRGSLLTAPFNADYIFMAKEYNSTLEKHAYKYASGQWNIDGAGGTPDLRNSFTVNYGNASGNLKDIEISIPRSAIGRELSGDAIRVIIYCKDLDNATGWGYLHRAVPDNGTTDGTGDKIFSNWYGFELKSGITPNSGTNYNRNLFVNWDLKLSASISSAGLSDNNNYAGVSINATEGYDSGLDIPKPPPAPSNYVYLNFPHPSWPLGPNFRQDITAYKNLDTNTISWDLSVLTDIINSNLSINASEFSDIPVNYNIYLKDMSTGNLHNLRQNPTYTYNSGAQAGERLFKLIIGKYVPNIYSVSSVNFGDVKIDNDSVKNITIYNTGLDTLKISAINISGVQFSFSGVTPPFNIISGGSVLVAVKFSPLQAGAQNGQLQILSNDPDTPVLNIALQGTGIKPTLTKKYPKGWNLTGIPLVPNSFIADSIFKPYASNYLLYNYKKETGYMIADTLKIGEGYWLGIYDTINVSMTGTPITNDTLIDLKPGWNIISHPFVKNFRKAKIKVKKDAETVSIDSAAARGWLQSVLYKFSRSSNSYQTVDTLIQFDGYWISTLTDNLSLLFQRADISLKGNDEQPVTPETNELMKLNLIAGNSLFKDVTTFLGFNKNATEKFDNQYDLAKPPISPVEEAVELYFRHNDWNPLFSKYNSDMRNIPDAAEVRWEMEFYSRHKEKSFIRWGNIINSIQSGSIAYLKDVQTGILTDMRLTDSYYFEHSGGIRKFEIIISVPTAQQDIKPFNYNISQNYPNPFNPSTRIDYSIMNRNQTTLKVYNSLGEMVAILINKILEPGNYSVNFEGSRYPSGVYYYEIVSGNFREIKKMILMK